MNSEIFCTYEGRRDELVAYLYDDIAPAGRTEFDRHLAGCRVCRAELEALRDVRRELDGWAMPEVAAGVGGTAPKHVLRLVETTAAPASSGWWPRLADAPVWIQAAAAMLVIAASLGLANINLTYSRSAGLSVSTGWMARAPVSGAVAQPAAPGPVAVVQSEPDAWRAELAALEQRIARDLASRPASSTSAAGNEALLQRVRTLLQESEQRQQRELALRVAAVARDTQAQRQADLVRIDRSLGLIQSRTGVEVMRTQQQLNSLAQRVSQRE